MVLWKPLHWRPFLVASRLVRDLLLYAKHLFVAAIDGRRLLVGSGGAGEKVRFGPEQQSRSTRQTKKDVIVTHENDSRQNG
jgi:hypothetical protein